MADLGIAQVIWYKDYIGDDNSLAIEQCEKKVIQLYLYLPSGFFFGRGRG